MSLPRLVVMREQAPALREHPSYGSTSALRTKSKKHNCALGDCVLAGTEHCYAAL